MCSIHNDKAISAELMAMSGGWGGRGQGLGLLACVTGKVEGEPDEDDQKKGARVSGSSFKKEVAHDVTSNDALAQTTFVCMYY